MPLVRVPLHGHTVTVKLDGRVFVVRYDSNNAPIQIVERKKSKPVYGISYEFNQVFWSAKHHRRGKPFTRVNRILDAAASR